MNWKWEGIKGKISFFFSDVINTNLSAVILYVLGLINLKIEVCSDVIRQYEIRDYSSVGGKYRQLGKGLFEVLTN